MSRVTIAALQLGSSPDGTDATLGRLQEYSSEIRNAGAQLVVMPEALLGGYPKGEIFGTRLGYRTPEGREAFRQYFENAIDVPGSETGTLEQLAVATGASLVVGVIERAASTLYCTALYIDPEQGLVAKHRKLMPTGTERLIWGLGDGSTLPVVSTPVGRIGGAICWENNMPLLRAAMYAKGVDIWCAPTVDDRDSWICTMRHIAHEGRCFVVGACQILPSPRELGLEVEGRDPDLPLIRGGSLIVDPLGEVLAGPVYGEVGLILSSIDPDDLTRSRYDLDVSGHYARPDIFRLEVDERPRANATFFSEISDPATEDRFKGP
jgi:nitrilase